MNHVNSMSIRPLVRRSKAFLAHRQLMLALAVALCCGWGSSQQRFANRSASPNRTATATSGLHGIFKRLYLGNANGHWFDLGLMRTPVYPLFVRGVFDVFGEHDAAVVTMQLLLSSATVALNVLARRASCRTEGRAARSIPAGARFRLDRVYESLTHRGAFCLPGHPFRCTPYIRPPTDGAHIRVRGRACARSRRSDAPCCGVPAASAHPDGRTRLSGWCTSSADHGCGASSRVCPSDRRVDRKKCGGDGRPHTQHHRRQKDALLPRGRRFAGERRVQRSGAGACAHRNRRAHPPRR